MKFLEIFSYVLVVLETIFMLIGMRFFIKKDYDNSVMACTFSILLSAIYFLVRLITKC